ncbi:MAG: ABC transporter permease [Actinomycetota bacterium]
MQSDSNVAVEDRPVTTPAATRGRRKRHSYARSVIARTVRLVATFLLVTFLSAAFLNLVPGDPAEFVAGDSASPEVIHAVNQQYHFNDPLVVRYNHWLGGLLRGNLGESYLTHQPVWRTMTQRLPITLELAALAMLLSLAVAIPLAISLSRRPGSLLDRAFGAVSSAAISAPSFVVAILLIYFVSYRLGWLPVYGWTRLTADPLENLRHVALPVVSIALAETVVLTRVLRADLIETLQQDYIALARAKGLSPRRIMWKHALRPSLTSMMTLAALQLARFLGGTVVIESVFALPGLGTMALQAISAKDLAVVQAVVAFVAIAFLLVNFAVDTLYGVLDPRTRVRHD